MNKDKISINEYYLNDAIKKVEEAVKDGYTVDMKETYRLGTTSRIVMTKELSEEEIEAKEVEELSDWASQALEKEDNNKDDGSNDVSDDNDDTDSGDDSPEVPEQEGTEDWKSLDVEGLKSFAKENGIKIHHKMKDPAKIIAKIEERLESE